MAKRAATSVLDQDNWDREEEAEEPGVFQTATSEVLQSRVIKTAKRRIRMSDNNCEAKPSPFSGFSGFGKVASGSHMTSPFSFLNQSKTSSNSKDNNGTGMQGQSLTSIPKDASSSPLKTTSTSSFPSMVPPKDVTQSGSSDSVTTLPSSGDQPFKPFQHIFKAKPQNQDGQNTKSDNLELLKDLNLSCSKWISEHLDKNPYCILTPIFKDYEKHLVELNLNNSQDKTDEGREIAKKHFSNEKVECENPFLIENSNLSSKNQFALSKDDKASDSTPSDNKDVMTEKPADFKLGGFQPMKPFNFQFGANTTFNSGSSAFSLNTIAAKPVNAESECKKDEEDSEEPPKNDFVPVVEEDSVFDIKCKVFVKKEGTFVPRGVGTLFLKPVKGSQKTQVVVRAHTNLGNILLNFLLSPDTPVQKTGKNNAMLVCIPTPEAKPPPVPVLIRVKTTEECDTLIKKLQECKGT